MGVNFLITWAVIDPVMKAVITEMQGSSVVETGASSLTFVSFKFCIKLYVRRWLQALCLGHYGEVEMRVSTLASWYFGNVETRPSSSASW